MKLKELLDLMSAVASERNYSQPFICGGTPRDKYLKKLENVNDLDITTGDTSVQGLAKDVISILKKKYQIDSKVSDDGHITMFIGDLKVDFSSHFIVPNIDEILSKKGIKNPTELQREMWSRDFTCNSLLLTLDLKTIIDPLNRGLKDIKNKKVVPVLSPPLVYSELNKNRVVRTIYLAAKLGFDIDEEAKKWIKEHPQYIKLASERTITSKLNQALDYDPVKTLKLLDELNLWNYIPISERLYPYYIKRLKEGK